MTTANQLSSICSICRCEPTNAVKIDCGHVFCYMCIKSATETIGTCALCRQEVSLDFNFKRHQVIGPTKIPSSNNGYYWFYQGYKGWWLFDADTHKELEKAYQENLDSIPKQLAGHMYIINFRTMTQQRESGDGKARKIIRATLGDLDDNILGMAGLRSHDIDETIEMLKEM